MFNAIDANMIYHDKRKPEVNEQIDKVLRRIKNKAYDGYDYVIYSPKKRLSKEALSVIYDLGFSIQGYEGKYDHRYNYNFFWGDSYLNNPVNEVVEYDDSMDYTRD